MTPSGLPVASSGEKWPIRTPERDEGGEDEGEVALAPRTTRPIAGLVKAAQNEEKGVSPERYVRWTGLQTGQTKALPRKGEGEEPSGK